MDRRRCLLGVKVDKTHGEQNESAISPKLSVKAEVANRQGWATSGHRHEPKLSEPHFLRRLISGASWSISHRWPLIFIAEVAGATTDVAVSSLRWSNRFFIPLNIGDRNARFSSFSCFSIRCVNTGWLRRTHQPREGCPTG